MNRRRTRSSSCARFSCGLTAFFPESETGIGTRSGDALSKKLRYLFIYLLIVAAMGFLFQRMPTAYLPDEDQGFMYVQAMLPAGSTREQTEQVLDQVRSHFLEDEKGAVEACLTVAGRGFSGAGAERGAGVREA